MSGIITKAHLMSITIIFAAALLVSGLSLYRTLLVGVMGLHAKYESAMVSQSGNEVHDLTSKSYVSFPRVYTAINVGSFIVDGVEIYYLKEDGKSYESVVSYSSISEVSWILIKNAEKYCNVTMEQRGKKYYLILKEVRI